MVKIAVLGVKVRHGTGMSALRTSPASRLRLQDHGRMGASCALSRRRRCVSQVLGVPFAHAGAVAQPRERGERLQGRHVVDVQAGQLRDQG